MTSKFEFHADDPLLKDRLGWINVSSRDRAHILSMPGLGQEVLRFLSLPDFFGDSASIVIHPREAA